jgi:alanine racemase
MSTRLESERAWVEVSLANLVTNARTVSERAGGSALLPMVKADGYGLGVRRVVAALDAVNPWGFGVATVEEGIELRAAGVNRPIVVFTPARAEQLPQYRKHQLQAVLDDVDAAATWDAPYHLEIDTGMGRAGVRWSNASRLKAVAGPDAANPPEGAFTHFHSADERPDSVELQWKRFHEALSQFAVRPPLVHAANSAGVWRVGSALDLVRPGIFLYGGRAGNDLPAPAPVATVRARIVSLRRLEPGDTVSYGAEWSAPAATWVATLGIGYADGVPRAVQNRAMVLAGGKRYPLVGRVTMDMIVVDLGPGGNEEHRIGDVVTVIGRDGEEEITVDEYAAWAGTISYEILVGLGARLRRVYTEP